MSDDNQSQTSDNDGSKEQEPVAGKKTNEPKMVLESDLITVKKGLQKEIKDAQSAHETAIGDVQGKLNIATNALATAEAKVQTLEEKDSQSVSSEELTRAKDELKAAQESSEGLATKVLEYRRKNIVTNFGIPEDTIKEKTLEELGHIEEALTLVQSTKGIGNYAAGGGGGGGTTPETPMERAKRTLDEAEAKRGRVVPASPK